MRKRAKTGARVGHPDMGYAWDASDGSHGEESPQNYEQELAVREFEEVGVWEAKPDAPDATPSSNPGNCRIWFRVQFHHRKGLLSRQAFLNHPRLFAEPFPHF